MVPAVVRIKPPMLEVSRIRYGEAKAPGSQRIPRRPRVIRAQHEPTDAALPMQPPSDRAVTEML
jgi:hypothetical protein